MLELVTTFNLEISICQSISWQVPPLQDNDYSELLVHLNQTNEMSFDLNKGS